MTDEPNPHDTAAALLDGLGQLLRRLRQVRMGPGEPSAPERTALARLERGGPATSAELARREQISPQSMGATLAALESRGLVEVAADPLDGRRKVHSVSADGRRVLHDKRSARTELVADVLTTGFDRAELAQLASAAPLLIRLAGQITPAGTSTGGRIDAAPDTGAATHIGEATDTGATPDTGTGTRTGPAPDSSWAPDSGRAPHTGTTARNDTPGAAR
jgi:DNA-binding MarR family transcriptional regulator